MRAWVALRIELSKHLIEMKVFIQCGMCLVPICYFNLIIMRGPGRSTLFPWKHLIDEHIDFIT